MDSRMIKQLQDMQKKMVKAQEDLGNETVTASAGGGAVTVEMNGHHKVTGITIDKDALDPEDVETLQDMILAAFDLAFEKADQMAEKKMSAFTGGMKLPGMF